MTVFEESRREILDLDERGSGVWKEFGICLMAIALLSPGIFPPAACERTEQREPCNDYSAAKRPMFGDLQVHSGILLRANTGESKLPLEHTALPGGRGESLLCKLRRAGCRQNRAAA